MAAFAMTSFAQSTQEYYKVEFTVPIVGSNTGTNNSVAATMKDDFTYCNPLHEYLVFPAGNRQWRQARCSLRDTCRMRTPRVRPPA